MVLRRKTPQGVRTFQEVDAGVRLAGLASPRDQLGQQVHHDTSQWSVEGVILPTRRHQVPPAQQNKFSAWRLLTPSLLLAPTCCTGKLSNKFMHFGERTQVFRFATSYRDPFNENRCVLACEGFDPWVNPFETSSSPGLGSVTKLRDRCTIRVRTCDRVIRTRVRGSRAGPRACCPAGPTPRPRSRSVPTRRASLRTRITPTSPLRMPTESAESHRALVTLPHVFI